MFFNGLLHRTLRGIVVFAIATSLLLGNSLLYAGAVSAEPNEPVVFGGETLMPIPDGVALSWEIDCFWGEPISYGGKAFRAMGYANGQMVNFMDTEGSYWPARFRLEPGEKLTLEGYFPHSRYASFNSYGGGAPTASLYDANIEPDPGSSNPFKQDAQRDTADDQRHYTIYVVNEPEPEELEPNTLYARPAAAPYDIVELRYRTYLVDQTLQEVFDQRGGVPLPMPTVLTLADGQELPGSTMCDPDRAMAQRMFFRAVPPYSTYSEDGEELVEGVASWWQSYPCTDTTPEGEFCNDPFTAPAQNPPVTEKFFGIPYSVKGVHLPPDEREALKPTEPSCGKLTEGFDGNADNSYLITFLNNRFGKVVHLQGRYPITPRTYFDATTWDESNAQLRYWSVMSGNEFPSTQIAAGVIDEQIPINEDGYFSIVVSKPEDRPTTATQACGHAWLDWGRRGDFTGRDGQTTLVWRHTLKLNGFEQSGNSVCEPGDEQIVMGDYLPSGQYFEGAAEFDAAVGCLATE